MPEESTEPLVTGIPRISVTPDGEIASMEFALSDNTKRHLSFGPKTFLGFVNKAFQLFVHERIQKGLASGHSEVQPIRATKAMAQESVGGGHVVLVLRMDNGLPVSFSLGASEAEELHRQIGKAVKKARAQSSAKRH